MTAFAAVLARDGAAPDHITLAGPAAALARIYGTPPRCVVVGPCALLTAPLHADHSSEPFVEPASRIGSAGQVVLEDTRALARELGKPAEVSDLELIAAAYSRWGDDFTRRISGEFAFVVTDAAKGVLLSARDGLGIRLLYAAESPHVVVVTNVLAAALAGPGMSDRLDEEALVEFLAYGAPAEGSTAFRAVRVIPPGHTLRLQAREGTASLVRHWWFPQQQGGRPRRGRQEILEGYRAVLQNAVADRVRTPRVAVLMSGGVDSTTIAAAGRHAAPDVELHAYISIYGRVDSTDEFDHARRAAEYLNLTLTPVAGDRHEALDNLRHGTSTPMPIDEPTLSDWRALAGAAARHGTVALYGEDGDSLFRSPTFGELRRSSSVSELGSAIGRYVAAHRRLPYLGLHLRRRLGLEPGRSAPLPPSFLSTTARAMLRQREAPRIFGGSPEPLPRHPTRGRTQSVLAGSVGRYLAPLIAAEFTCQRIELRCPLLDTRVIQYVVDVPAIPWAQNKHLPRAAYRGLLPDAVLDRAKKGIAGLHEVLVASWRDKGSRELHLGDSPLRDWIDVSAWRRSLEADDPCETGVAWRVLQLDAWLTRRREIGQPDITLCTA